MTYGLALPAHVQADIERDRMVDRMARAALPVQRAVKAYDPRCDLKFIGEQADPEYGVVPYRWHLVRYNDPPAANSYMAIVTEDGGYRDPDFGVLKDLDDRDLWKHGIPQPEQKPEPSDDGRTEELAHDLRAGARLAGDKGLTGKWWGKK